MEERISLILKEIGYNGALLNKAELSNAINDGPKSHEYTKTVSFITNELKVLCKIDEEVNPVQNPEDSITFMMELSSFLKELGCPYTALTQGHISDRLTTKTDNLLLLDYLTTELMAARILREKKPEKKFELKLQETSESADLRKICMTFRFPKPPPNITLQQLFQKLIPTAQAVVQKAGKDLLGNPIFNGFLSDKQWNTLENVQKDLCKEYTIRREMLLKRLDCTIQSFEWSDKLKAKEELIEKIYAEKRKLLKVDPDIDLSDLLSARDDIAIIEKTSNANVRKHTQSSINKVIIGQVPDRGGRTSEQAPPPPEMPSWQQRSSAPSGGRGGGFGAQGRGGGRGDFRGNSQQNRSFDSAGSYGGGSNYNRVGSNYSQGTSDYNKGGGYGRGDSVHSGNDYSRAGGNYNRGGNDYSQGASDYNKTGSYSRAESVYSGNDYSRAGGNYNRGGNDYNKGADYSRNFDSAGSYGRSYVSDKDSSTNYNQNYSRGGFDSAGSFGGYKSSNRDYQYDSEPKRVKTYDSFQSNRTTYADQYVQESQQNQQYHPRGERGGRGGRSHYNRGGNHTYR